MIATGGTAEIKQRRREDALKRVLVNVRKIASDFEIASGESPTDGDLEALLRLTVAEAARRYEAVSGRKHWVVSPHA